MPRLRKQSLEKKRRLKAAYLSKETPEQRALRLEKCMLYSRARRAQESKNDREARLARGRALINSSRANLKLKANAVNIHELFQNITSISSLENITNLPGLTHSQSEALKAVRLLNSQRESAAKSAAARRSLETPEQRAARLEKCRIRAAVVRSCETEEARETRLARQRIRSNAARKKNASKDENAKYMTSTIGIHLMVKNSCDFTKEMSEQQMAYKPDLFLGDQRQTSATSSLFYDPGNPLLKYIASHNYFDESKECSSLSLLRQEEEESQEENDSSSPLAINVECEVTIEEGSELEENKLMFKREPAEVSVFKEEPAEVSVFKTDFADPLLERENMEGGKNINYDPVMEGSFETILIGSSEIKQEIPEREDGRISEEATEQTHDPLNVPKVFESPNRWFHKEPGSWEGLDPHCQQNTSV